MLQPQSAIIAIFKEIIDELNALVQQKGLDEFTFARKLHALEARALDLKDRGELGLSFSALGSISAARGDKANMKMFHQKSIERLIHPIIFRNYAVSMNHLGMISEALEFLEKSCRDHPDFPECLEYLVKLCYDASDEQKFLEYVKLYESRTKKPHPYWKIYLQEIEDAHALTRICTKASLPSLLRQ